MSELPKVLIKVLIVEDSPIWQSDFAINLKGKVEVIVAYTIPQAKQCANEYAGKLAAIGISSMSDGGECASEPLARAFKLAFPNLPIFSITNHPIFQKTLLSAGCNYACWKKDFPEKLCEVLGIKGGE